MTETDIERIALDILKKEKLHIVFNGQSYSFHHASVAQRDDMEAEELREYIKQMEIWQYGEDTYGDMVKPYYLAAKYYHHLDRAADRLLRCPCEFEFFYQMLSDMTVKGEMIFPNTYVGDQKKILLNKVLVEKAKRMIEVAKIHIEGDSGMVY